MVHKFLLSLTLLILTITIVTAQDCNNLSATFTSVQPTCGLQNGSLTVIVSGGSAPYTYFWNNSSSISALTNLSPAGYAVTVSDVNGCTTSNSITLNNSICPKINTASIVTNITQSGATVSWPAVPCASKYRVLVKNVSTSVQTTTIVSGINPSITLTGLQTNTTYQIRIRTQCSQNGTVVSQLSPITSFTTLNSQGILCLPPFNIETTDITPTSAKVNWLLTPGAIQYNLRYRKSGTIPWSNMIISGTSTNVLIPNLLQLTTYEFQIRSKCNSNPDEFSPYSGMNSFTTGTDQLAIISLNCSNTLNSGNLFTCKPATGVSSQIPYTSTNAEPFQAQSVNSTGVTGLVATLTAGYLSSGAGLLTVNISGTPANVGLAFFEITIASETCTFSRVVSSPVINPDSVQTDTVFSCTEYTWNGTTYYESGTYTWNGTTAGGCDTMAKLNLTIQPIWASAYNNVGPDNACGGSVYYNCLLTTGATVIGGSPPFSYIWNNGGTTQQLNNLCNPGIYSFTVTDTRGCTASATTSAIVIVDPAYYSLSIVGPSSICSNQGPIVLTVVGGIANSNYVWSNGATTQSILVVESGTYSVSAYSNSSCALFDPASKTVIIRQPSLTTIDTVVCGSSFTWNGNTYTQDGTYTWTGTNALGCDSVVILHLTLTPISVMTFDNTTPENLCFDAIYTNCQLSITSQVIGGTPPYTYLWSTGATSSSLSDLCIPANYGITVTDANGCDADTINTLKLSQPQLLNLTISGPVSICSSSGPAVLIANGAYPTSFYQWSTGATTQAITVTQSGTYSLSVYGFCYQGFASKTITIRQASSTTIDTVVCGSSFTWNGNTYTQDGTYTWTGTNALGCDSAVTLHLTLSPMLITTYDNTTPENLCGDMIYYNCLLSIGAVVSGGSAPYNFVWNTGATSQVINNLCNPGLYSVFVTDATGCTAQGFRVTQQVLPGVLMVSISGPSVLCRNFGPAILTVNGGYPESTYQWSNGATTQSIAVSETGTYSVTVSGICYLGTASKNVIINECRIGEIVNTASVVLYPNPTNKNINVVINAVSETQTTIRITDLLGRVMLNENEALIGGNNTITYNMSDYAAGVYLVLVGNGNTQQVYKVVKE